MKGIHSLGPVEKNKIKTISRKMLNEWYRPAFAGELQTLQLELSHRNEWLSWGQESLRQTARLGCRIRNGWRKCLFCQTVMQIERFLITQALQMLCHLFCVADVNTGLKTCIEIEIRSTQEEEDGNTFNTSERGDLIFLFFHNWNRLC